MLEQTRMVVSFIAENDLTEKAIREVSDFLKEFGHETGQENVAFVLDGEMYYIEISQDE